jgi:hypothetical protein
MTQTEAIELLIQAAHASQQKGIWTLQTAAVLSEAVDTLTAPQENGDSEAAQKEEKDV